MGSNISICEVYKKWPIYNRSRDPQKWTINLLFKIIESWKLLKQSTIESSNSWQISRFLLLFAWTSYLLYSLFYEKSNLFSTVKKLETFWSICRYKINTTGFAAFLKRCYPDLPTLEKTNWEDHQKSCPNIRKHESPTQKALRNVYNKFKWNFRNKAF